MGNRIRLDVVQGFMGGLQVLLFFFVFFIGNFKNQSKVMFKNSATCLFVFMSPFYMSFNDP